MLAGGTAGVFAGVVLAKLEAQESAALKAGKHREWELCGQVLFRRAQDGPAGLGIRVDRAVHVPSRLRKFRVPRVKRERLSLVCIDGADSLALDAGQHEIPVCRPPRS